MTILDEIVDKQEKYFKRKMKYPAKLYLGYEDYILFMSEINKTPLLILPQFPSSARYFRGLEIKQIRKNRYLGVK